MAGAMAPTIPDDGMAALQAEAAFDDAAATLPAQAQAWPSAGRAWFALFAIVLATFLSFFDQTVFGMLAQRIKQDFALSDEVLGFLGGPASVIFFVVVGIPLARLADFFPPKKIMRAFAVLQLGFIGGTTAVMALGGMFGLAGAVPQNAGIQHIAPNEMRGQVTAIYLFMFTFFGAMGSFVVGVVAQHVVGVEAQLWKALVITAAALLPIATVSMILAIRPYREEVARLEAQGR